MEGNAKMSGMVMSANLLSMVHLRFVHKRIKTIDKATETVLERGGVADKKQNPVIKPKTGVWCSRYFSGDRAVSAVADPLLCVPGSPRVCSFRKIQ
jgi:hypothetical protein